MGYVVILMEQHRTLRAEREEAWLDSNTKYQVPIIEEELNRLSIKIRRLRWM